MTNKTPSCQEKISHGGKACGNKELHNEEGYCVVHCDKSDYISAKIYPIDEDGNTEQRRNFINGFKGGLEGLIEKLNEAPPGSSNNEYLHLEYINFPAWIKHIKGTHFQKALKGYENIFFENCQFWNNDFFELEKIEGLILFFKDCIFNASHTVYPFKSKVINGVHKDFLYQDCRFKQDVQFYPSPDYFNVKFLRENKKRPPVIDSPMFANCVFDDELNIKGWEFSAQIFVRLSSEVTRLEIKKLVIKNSTFNADFEIEGKIESIVCDSVEFNSPVYINDSEINTASFSKIAFHKAIHFSHCSFGTLKSNEPDAVLFEKTHFHSSSGFTNCKFDSGLNIEDVFFAEDSLPNFFNSRFSQKETTRETFRIIKASFDAQDNKIEANKIFSREMRKYFEELRQSLNPQNKIEGEEENQQTEKSMKEIRSECGSYGSKVADILIYSLNLAISGFGSSYVFPLMWLLLLSYCQLDLSGEFVFLGSDSSFHLTERLEKTIANILPYKDIFDYGKGGVSDWKSVLIVIGKVVLIWHLIIAVKRKLSR